MEMQHLRQIVRNGNNIDISLGRKRKREEKDMKKYNRVFATGLTCLLTTSLLLGNVEYATHTYAAGQSVKNNKVTVMAGAVKEKNKIEKEESVYVTLDANGTTKTVIVSDWLKNSGINGTIEDVSTLKDIQNTKGDEPFTQDGEELTWEAGEEDIYYQGTTDAELPVSMKITYKLDGKEISPKDLLGKSGKLEIKIQYENSSKQTVKVGEKEKEIFTPFLMATGMFLPVDHFSNVNVDHGKVVSEGDNDIVAVYGMPGLKESLDLDSIDFGDDSDIDLKKINDKITDSATITADVTEFEMGQSYTVATPNLFNHFNFAEIRDTDDLEDKMDELTEAANDLVDGSDKINDGLDTLDKNFVKYKDGIKKLRKGVKTLDSGSEEIKKATKNYTDATDKILDAVGTYVDGTKTYAKNEKKYDAAAKKLVDGIGELYKGVKSFPKSYSEFHTKLNEYASGVNELLSKENMEKLSGGITALSTGVKTINDSASKLNQSKAGVDTAIAGLEELLKNYQALAAAESDPVKKATYEKMAESMEQAVAGTKQYVAGAEAFAAAVDAATNGKSDGEYDAEGQKDLLAGIGSLGSAVEKMSGYAEKIRESKTPLMEASEKIQSGIGTVTENLGKASAGGNKLVKNNKKLADGADQLIKNAGKLKSNSKKLTDNSDNFRDATKKLAKGTKELLSGVDTLTDKTGDVSKGIHKLSKGSGDLFDGMKKFKKKGVLKLKNVLLDLLEGAEDIQDTAEAISDASKDYKTFSGIAKGMDGNVKFIMTTEEIRDEE